MPFPHTADWQIFDANGVRKYVNVAEREAVLAEADRCNPVTRALCYLLVNTGARISEALELQRCWLDAELMAVTFRTLKRRKLTFRRVPIPEEVVAMLLALSDTESGRLFTMHRSTAWRQVAAIMQRGGVIGPMATCRGLRHGYGVRAISRGVPPSTLMRLLGHADIATTLIYVDTVGADERHLVARMW